MHLFRGVVLAILTISVALWSWACGSRNTASQESTVPTVTTPQSVDEPQANSSTKTAQPPWIVPALRMDRKIYALLDPSPSELPEDTEMLEDGDLEVFQRIFFSHENMVTDGARVTIIGNSETCVGTVAAEVDLYMACSYEMARGEFIKRLGPA